MENDDDDDSYEFLFSLRAADVDVLLLVRCNEICDIVEFSFNNNPLDYLDYSKVKSFWTDYNQKVQKFWKDAFEDYKANFSK